MDQELAEKFKISIDQLRPWHNADPFYQEAPPSQEIDLNPKFKDIDINLLTINGGIIYWQTALKRVGVCERS